jgi:hypothetical protein
MFVENIFLLLKLKIMAALEFKFNKAQLEALINLTKNGKISVSMCSIPDDGPGGKMELYLCAIAHDAQGNVRKDIRPIIGCPFPPPWNEENDLFIIDHASLVTAPKFVADAASLIRELPKNLHVPGTKGHNEVTALLEADTPVGGDLVTFVTFQMKDAAATPVGIPIKAVS